jgi:hypothetical protein
MKPQERLVRVVARVEPDLRRALAAAAQRNRRSMSNYLRDLLLSSLENDRARQAGVKRRAAGVAP